MSEKFTDEQIIEAFRWHNGNASDRCRNCPLEYTAFCDEVLGDLVLDLINRQKADIDELRKAKVVYETVDYCLGDLEDALKEIEEYKSEITVLKDSNKNLQELYCAEKEKVKKAKQKVVDACKNLQDAKAEIERLRKENEILSKNAAEAFQEGLNENRRLFVEEILKEFSHFLIDRSEGG